MVYTLCHITAATLDRVASETLAKVEEKCPIITKTPAEVTLSFLLPKLLSDCCTHFLGVGGVVCSLMAQPWEGLGKCLVLSAWEINFTLTVKHLF